ncbi:MAG: TIGR03936 family radical SAM-associated protein [Planctomycetota bacterium]
MDSEPVDGIRGSGFENAGGQIEGVRHRYAVDFAVGGDVRFCSHRDMMRLFARAMARAELPVRFSAGFNPHPKLSLIPPRPVGVASEGDRLVLELTQDLEADELLRRLSATLPRGITLLQARRLVEAEKCLPHRVCYVVAVPHADLEALRSRATHLPGSGPIFVQRVDKKMGQPKRVDIAPYIESLALTPEGIAMTLLATREGTAKPSEVCAALGITDDAVTSRTRRVKVEWE